MKKFSVIALVLAVAMFAAVPAMAVTMDFSGYYRARGFFLSNPTLNDKTSRTDSFMDMRLKMIPVLKVHDRLSITSEVWAVSGNTNTTGNNAEELFGDTHSNALRWERAYMTANFDMFDLHVGRMSGGICGLTYCDSESDADRIKVGLKGLDPLGITLIYQKSTEKDFSRTVAPTTADSDNDAYMGLFTFKPEGIDSGILVVYYNYDGNNDDTDPLTLAARANPYDSNYWNLNPWFKGTFGPITAMAELEWKFGKYADYNTDTIAVPDRDYDSKRWILDASFDFGQGNAGLGWAHADGQDRVTTGNEDYTNANLGGADWEPLLILTNSTAGIWLGGVGNLNPDNGGTTSNLGFDIVYGYGSFNVMENVSLNAIFAWAKADEVGEFERLNSLTNVDDDLGWEFDVGCKIQLMDNLTYDATVGYYSAGDLWKRGSTVDNLDDCWAIMHTIQVTF